MLRKYLYRQRFNELTLLKPRVAACVCLAADNRAIASGDFKWDKPVQHTHEGSIGNLQTEQVRNMMENLLPRFDFGSPNSALNALVGT